jgi:cytochrome P450
MPSDSAACPGPPIRWFGLPLARQFAADPLAFTTEMVRRYGPVVRLKFGPQRAYLVADPAGVHAVLAGDARRFRKEPRSVRTVSALDGRSLITTEGDYWLRQRKLLQRGFTPPRMERFARVIAEATERMLAGWPQRGELEICEAFNRLTLEIVGRAMFAVDLSRDAPRLAESAEVVSEAIVREMSGVPLPDWLPTAAQRRKRAAIRDVDAAMRGLIAQRRRELAGQLPRQSEGRDNESPRDDLLSMLITARCEEGSPLLDDQQIRDEAVTLMVAGYDTTASGLAWTFLLLAQYPEVAGRAVKEAASVLGDRPPQLADYERLTFMQQIVRESLRLYPPAWILMLREAVEDVELCGYAIPRRSWIYLVPWVTHRSERWFAEPLRFDPERFSPARIGEIPPHAYFPFGDGPHACIGERLALLEMTLAAAMILRRFHVTLADSHGPVEVEAHTAIRPRGGLRLAVERR